MDPHASNYDSEATKDDGSCMYDPDNVDVQSECSEREKEENDDKLDDLKTCKVCFYNPNDEINFAEECTKDLQTNSSYDIVTSVPTTDINSWSDTENHCGTQYLKDIYIQIEDHDNCSGGPILFETAEKIIEKYHPT